MSLTTALVSNVWIKRSGTVSASATDIVDRFNEAAFIHADYIVVLTKTDNSATRSFKLTVNKRGATLKDSVHSRIGDSLRLDVTTSIVSGEFRLSLVNNESFDVNWSLARIQI